jgi:hypothetical protein
LLPGGYLTNLGIRQIGHPPRECQKDKAEGAPSLVQEKHMKDISCRLSEAHRQGEHWDTAKAKGSRASQVHHIEGELPVRGRAQKVRRSRVRVQVQPVKSLLENLVFLVFLLYAQHLLTPLIPSLRPSTY